VSLPDFRHQKTAGLLYQNRIYLQPATSAICVQNCAQTEPIPFKKDAGESPLSSKV